MKDASRMSRQPVYRLRQHNGEIQNGAKATEKGRPWTFVAIVDGFAEEDPALKFESIWKRWGKATDWSSIKRDPVAQNLVYMTTLLGEEPWCLPEEHALKIYLLDEDYENFEGIQDLPGHISTKFITPSEIPLPREAEPDISKQEPQEEERQRIILPQQPRLYRSWADYESSDELQRSSFESPFEESNSKQEFPESQKQEQDVMSAKAGRLLSEQIVLDPRMPAVNVRAGGLVVDLRSLATPPASSSQSSVQSDALNSETEGSESESTDAGADSATEDSETHLEVESTTSGRSADGVGESEERAPVAAQSATNKREGPKPANSVSVLLGVVRWVLGQKS